LRWGFKRASSSGNGIKVAELAGWLWRLHHVSKFFVESWIEFGFWQITTAVFWR
jgi:hypothetical protein